MQEEAWELLLLPCPYSCLCIIFCFPQKTLPLLENQIKENHEKITEELQKYGSDVPEDEHEKMFFLIDVSIAIASSRGIAPRGPERDPVSHALSSCTPKADSGSVCPLSTKEGPGRGVTVSRE